MIWHFVGEDGKQIGFLFDRDFKQQPGSDLNLIGHKLLLVVHALYGSKEKPTVKASHKTTWGNNLHLTFKWLSKKSQTSGDALPLYFTLHGSWNFQSRWAPLQSGVSVLLRHHSIRIIQRGKACMAHLQPDYSQQATNVQQMWLRPCCLNFACVFVSHPSSCHSNNAHKFARPSSPHMDMATAPSHREATAMPCPSDRGRTKATSTKHRLNVESHKTHRI